MSAVPTETLAPPAHFGPGRRWYAFSRFLRGRFGGKVYRVTVDAGFTCPNVDGSVAVGGCVYCDNRSFSPNRRLPRRSVRAQVERGIGILGARHRADKFLAYFQAATNTYAPPGKLRRLYDEALEDPRIVGLIVGTRPDCVGEDVLDLLQEYAEGHPPAAPATVEAQTLAGAAGWSAGWYVSLELGLQTIHDRSLDWMNRGHHADAFFEAVERCARRPFNLCAHVILGLPGESHDDMLATADALAQLPIHAVKIHNLHVVKDTPLEPMHRAGEVRMMDFDEYVAVTCDFLERLPATMVIERLNGDAPPDYLVAPAWCLEKPRILAAIDRELARRGSWQGKHYRRTAATPSGRRGLPVIEAFNATTR
jgi:radical SAM superfamily enzyme